MVTFGLHCILTLSLFSLVFSFSCVLVLLCSRFFVSPSFVFFFLFFCVLVLLCSCSLAKVIYEEQEVSECYYFILKGSVVVRKRYGDGGTHSKQLQRYNAGNSFGENGLSKYAMTGGNEELHNVSTTTTVTVEDCEFLILPKMQYQHCANSFQEKHLEARMNVLKLSPGK